MSIRVGQLTLGREEHCEWVCVGYQGRNNILVGAGWGPGREGDGCEGGGGGVAATSFVISSIMRGAGRSFQIVSFFSHPRVVFVTGARLCSGTHRHARS